MTDLGRFQLGDWLPLCVQTHGSTYAPTLPDNCPTAKIFDESGSLIETLNMPINDRYGPTTALFMRRRLLDSSYAAGKYMIFYLWIVSSTGYPECQQFEVVAGGSADGNVIGNYWNETPAAGYVITALHGGKLLTNRGPR